MEDVEVVEEVDVEANVLDTIKLPDLNGIFYINRFFTCIVEK